MCFLSFPPISSSMSFHESETDWRVFVWHLQFILGKQSEVFLFEIKYGSFLFLRPLPQIKRELKITIRTPGVTGTQTKSVSDI